MFHHKPVAKSKDHVNEKALVSKMHGNINLLSIVFELVKYWPVISKLEVKSLHKN